MTIKRHIKFSIQKLVKKLLSIVILVLSISFVFSQNNESPFIYVLGNVQDAGLPHIGCDEKICINAFNEKKQYYKIALVCSV